MADFNPSPRELEILKILWELGSASVREVLERMCPSGERAFNTVQSLLRIMEKKGLVTHKAEGRAFIYRAKHSRQHETERLLDTLFDGAIDQFVVSLISAKDTSPDELKSLERIISQARKEKLSKRDKGNSK